MRLLVLGGDGYLGWPTSMHLAARGHQVLAVDNYLRRTISLQTSSDPLFEVPNLVDRVNLFKALSGHAIKVEIGDLRDFRFMESLVQRFQPEAVVHYAEQPSAPYSMMGQEQARLTLLNNLEVTLNLILTVTEHAPGCHIVKLGTMGEYGTPNIDIEEGWLEIEHNNRKETFLFPRAAGSLYHTTKVMDTDLLWLYTRLKGLRVTDLMQGPVYGLETDEAKVERRLYPHFNYDDIFGTVVNRFMVQAVAGIPLTVYGTGGQTRGYLNIQDTMQCVELAVNNPIAPGELCIFNQFTETFSVNDLAEITRQAGKLLRLNVAINHIDNPRKEAEEHYYNPKHTGLLEMGLKPHYLTVDRMATMLEEVLRHKDRIEMSRIVPRVNWNK